MSSNSGDLLLDTHVWFWLAAGSENLAAPVVDRIVRAAKRGELLLTSFSLLEVTRLVSMGALIVDQPITDWTRTALRATRARVIPLTAEIAIEAYQLPGHFHKDPADRVIVATARLTGSVLATRDRLILGYGQQRHVEVFTV